MAGESDRFLIDTINMAFPSWVGHSFTLQGIVAKMVVFDLLINGIIETDSGLGRHFVLTHVTPSTLKAFNLTDFGEEWSLGIQSVQGVPGSLIRWGRKGLAFRTDGDQVFFVTFPYP